MTDFFRGLWLPVQAARLMLRSKKLFGLGLLCSAVTLASLLALVWLLGGYTGELVNAFWARPAAWYAVAGWYLVLALSFVLLLAVGANTLPLLLLAPLQDPLSEAAEELAGDFTAPPFSLSRFLGGIASSLTHNLARVSLLLGGHLLLLALHLIPGLGSAAWTALSTLWTIVWLSGEYLSAPMARHFHSFREVPRALLRRKALGLGFGSAVFLLLWVPVLNFFFIPIATVGGTLLYLGLRRSQDISAPRSEGRVGNGEAAAGV